MNNGTSHFKNGFIKGIPIALGYIPVSFTFGLMAVNGGIDLWTAVLISMSNLTSAGQFAGVELLLANAPLIEITLTTFVINIRYMLMSLSLSQKIVPGMPLLERCIMAFGITDETFAVSSLEKGSITFPYMMGLISGPYFGWALGTFLGGAVSSVLPDAVQNTMGIALYAMFLALIIPPSKKSKAVLCVLICAVLISSILKWVPVVNRISGGFGIIITTILASALGAALFPRSEEEAE